MRTIQDRIHTNPVLDALAGLNAEVEIALHQKLNAGLNFAGDLAKTFYQRFGISAKNLEHVHISLKGRIDSVRECAVDNAKILRTKIKAKKQDIASRKTEITKSTNAIGKELRKRLSDLDLIAKIRERRAVAKGALHQHKRRLDRLHVLLARAEARAANSILCFGSRALLRERSRLDRTGAFGADGKVLTEAQRQQAIAAWRMEWDRRRNGEIFIPGDALQSCGNAFVKLVLVEDDGMHPSWDVVLRLPQALKDHAATVSRINGVEIRETVVGRVRFPHGGEQFAAALERGDNAMTWRIQRHDSHDGSWVVSCTFKDEIPEVRDTHFGNGALGVDFNADHLALALMDGRGCLVRTWTIPLDTKGLSSNATLDLCRRVAKHVATIAWDHHVPVVSERLDFSKRKAELRNSDGPAYARMLHGLAYAMFGAALESACARKGVGLSRVNPAYTSIIGFAKFAKPNGIGPHHAAACAIARRGQNFSERLPPQVSVQLIAGVHGTLTRPDRIARRHVWTSWAVVSKERKTSIRSFLRERAARSNGGNLSGAEAGPGRSTGSTGMSPSSAVTGLWAATVDAKIRIAA
jgi:IS605 OrfB family transposase